MNKPLPIGSSLIRRAEGKGGSRVSWSGNQLSKLLRKLRDGLLERIIRLIRRALCFEICLRQNESEQGAIRAKELIDSFQLRRTIESRASPDKAFSERHQ